MGKLDHSLWEEPELSPIQRSLRQSWEQAVARVIQAYHEDMEAWLLRCVCDRLADRGRILPGEVIGIEPRPGGGSVQYHFPDHQK